MTETELKLGFELTALQGDAEKQQGDSHPVQGKTAKMPHLPDRNFNQTLVVNIFKSCSDYFVCPEFLLSLNKQPTLMSLTFAELL